VYSNYTILRAEVPSTLERDAVLRSHAVAHDDQRERIVLLQHAIDDMVGTFFRQCLFADYELQAHRWPSRENR
jgi:oligoendopeptidase F